jgi:tetratricopeptide (TPR) repeat protein
LAAEQPLSSLLFFVLSLFSCSSFFHVMLMDLAEAPHEENLISLCDDDGDEVPDMPFFEASNIEDRPMAPAAEDYPLGCEVELRDVEFAKMAQESRHWEPIMETFFAIPRRRVQVDRHTGDYTFVMCNDIDGFERVGCTLYRACLSEPKVKATRYYSSIRSGLSGLELEDRTEDVLSKPVQPGGAAGAKDSENSAVESVNNPATGNASGSAHSSVKPARTTTAANGSVVDDARRRSFMSYMKKGTAEINKKNCEAALRYYNRALEEMPEEEARVRSSRSVAFLLAGEKERALEDAKRVTYLMPGESVGFIRTGNVLRSMKKFVDAQQMYATAMKWDPTNSVVRNLLEGNSVAMLYEGRTKRYNKLRIVYDEHLKRAIAVAAQNIDANEVVIKEGSSSVFPLSAGLYRVICGRKRCSLCCHCGRPFVDESMITEQIPGLTKPILNSLHVCNTSVPCDNNCNALYCSESCKSKAWVEHHWVECAQRGRWREGASLIHRLLDQYVCTNASPNDAQVNVSPVPQCVADDTRPIVKAACIRIAVRMMSRMVSSVLPAQEAAQQYRWLPVAPAVREQRAEMADLLRTCYTTLSRCFASEDLEQLPFDVFQECYEKAKSNALMICCSMWPKVVERVKSHLDFVNAEDRPVVLGAQSDETPLQSCLHHILNAPQYGVPGTYHMCISLFELASLMTPNNCTPGEVSKPNVVVRTFSESAANLRLRTLRPIAKKEVLSMAWPYYDFA